MLRFYRVWAFSIRAKGVPRDIYRLRSSIKARASVIITFCI